MESDTPKKRFTVGIIDDVTHLSLDIKENPDTAPAGTTSCKFWGLGADGTVGANKNSIKIIGDHTDMYAQAYFAYDSKKSGGLTVSHLRFGHKPIKSTYYISKADFVACHKPSYVFEYDMVQDVKPGGSFLLNCQWSDDELDQHLPAKMKKYIAENNINFYTIDGVKLGKEIGLGQPHQHDSPVRLLQHRQHHPRRPGHSVHEGRRHEVLQQEGPEDRRHEPRGHRPRREGIPQGERAGVLEERCGRSR